MIENEIKILWNVGLNFYLDWSNIKLFFKIVIKVCKYLIFVFIMSVNVYFMVGNF